MKKMEQRTVSKLGIHVSAMGLGTWVFGGGIWWGPQEDADSVSVLERALASGVNLIDTAPVYGRGRSETLIGAFLEKRGLRERVILATKLGLSWEGRRIYHDLKKKKMMAEIDESRKRLRTDYIDIYQVHWPDPNTPMEKIAEVMYDFYKKGIIRCIGVSNYSVEQMEVFMKYAPLHTLQPPYNMFDRTIESEIVPFCLNHNISLLTYVPLYSGILTGKFFAKGSVVPDDLCRRNKKDLKEPFYSINREIISELGEIAACYERTLTQLVLNWTYNREGVTSVLCGARNAKQFDENIGCSDFRISSDDLDRIENILKEREQRILQIDENS